MKIKAREVGLFFYSQQFADGIRTTLAVLIPALLFSFLGYFQTGLILSLGCLCVSIVDAPGPIIHRKNSMFYCSLFLFAVAFVTGFARLNIYSMGLEVLLFSFFFSMFNVYGLRAATVGSACILIMVLSMDQPLKPGEVTLYAFTIFCGGLWYMLVSLLAHQAWPYRPAERALGESIRELATFLAIKADFYNEQTDLEEDYRKLVNQQMVVSEKQDAVRELLYKTRQVVKDSTPEGRRLVVTFIDSVDLFEDITATYYDYTAVRKRYAGSEVLKNISALISLMADELDNIGIAIHGGTPFKREINYDEALINLKNEIDAQTKKEPEARSLVLRKILVNLRKLMQRINDVLRYFEGYVPARSRTEKLEFSRFVGHQSLDPKIFWNNLNLESSIFKHSLRVAIACIIGFIIAKSIAYSHHSYWILMTISFMLKPAFSLTRQRNYERIIGTLCGVAIGIPILLFIQNQAALFFIMVFFMIGTYSFQRVKYFVSVVSMTPFILILFNFLGVGFISLVQERVIDTAIGCIIALGAGYLLFPNWEAEQLSSYLQDLVKANKSYFKKVTEALNGKPISTMEYKLVRKEVYVSSANLSSAFQRMLSEPKSKQKNKQELHQFVVLNHILFSNMATIASSVLHQNNKAFPDEITSSAKKILNVLRSNVKKFDADGAPTAVDETSALAHKTAAAMNAENVLLKEQLEFIYRISTDINKLTDKLIS